MLCDMMTRMAAMPTVSQALQRFAQEHRHHGELVGNATEPTPSGYRLWAQCACGERFERWVTEASAVEDLVWSELLLRVIGEIAGRGAAGGRRVLGRCCSGSTPG
jgi:hypothetical protein